MPPCIHRIFSSMRAHTGMTLNTSEKTFHNLRLYFLLPGLIHMYINHRIHRFCWCWSIRDYLAAGRSSLGTLSCRPAEDKYTLLTVFLCQCSRPGISSLCLLGTLRTRRAWSGQRIDHGCLRISWLVPPTPVTWAARGRSPWTWGKLPWFQIQEACNLCPWPRGACLWSCPRRFLIPAFRNISNINTVDSHV